MPEEDSVKDACRSVVKGGVYGAATLTLCNMIIDGVEIISRSNDGLPSLNTPGFGMAALGIGAVCGIAAREVKRKCETRTTDTSSAHAHVLSEPEEEQAGKTMPKAAKDGGLYGAAVYTVFSTVMNGIRQISPSEDREPLYVEPGVSISVVAAGAVVGVVAEALRRCLRARSEEGQVAMREESVNKERAYNEALKALLEKLAQQRAHSGVEEGCLGRV